MREANLNRLLTLEQWYEEAARLGVLETLIGSQNMVGKDRALGALEAFIELEWWGSLEEMVHEIGFNSSDIHYGFLDAEARRKNWFCGKD
jgi:hypothetical protein